MSSLPQPAPIDEIAGADAARFHTEIRPANRPVVMRGLVESWPVVAAARSGDAALVAYINRCGTSRPVGVIRTGPEARGRFFYNETMTGLNFESASGPLDRFLTALLDEANNPDPPALAVQSEVIPELSPEFATANWLDFVPGVAPRIWIGNRLVVAPHYDLMENIACCVAGRRRFTLFPPEAVANLYPGPFELTPAGTPVSMVDMREPDLERYPRFAQAWASASQATLGPGDALYIPYTWWHGVESLDAVNVLVNYWWNNDTEGLASPYDALLHAMLAFRHRPPHERAVWHAMLDHYVFEANGNPGEHLPMHARGILGPGSPQLFARMRALLRSTIR